MSQEAQGGGDERPRLATGRPGGDGRLHETGARVEAREAVARARDKTKELGRRVSRVGDLRNEEEAEGLGEVAEDADGGEDHAGEVAVGVADEDAGRVAVMQEESGGDSDPGQQEIEREEVRIGGRVRVRGQEVQGVVEDEEEGDDERLSHFDAVDTGQHVDRLRAEHGDAGHVDVVQETQVEEFAEVWLERNGDDDRCDTKVDKVDDQDGDGSESRNPPLVTPAKVEEVIADTEEGAGLEGDDSREVTSQLWGRLNHDREKKRTASLHTLLWGNR